MLRQTAGNLLEITEFLHLFIIVQTFCWITVLLNLPGLKAGDSGGTAVVASRGVNPSEWSSGLATAYPTSNIGGVQPHLRLNALLRGTGRRYVIRWGTKNSPGGISPEYIPLLRMFTAPIPSRCAR